MSNSGERAPSGLKPLKPRLLDIEIHSPTSEKEWKHWKKTFENYMSAHAAEGLTIDKLQVLTNFLSFNLYEYIDECGTYEDAIKSLDGLFIKTPNEVFARYLLATTKQRPGQSMDEYLQELKRLSKDCNFTDVDKVKHRDGFIRDAFISGIQSHSIRQRLLEESTLTMDKAFQKARALDIAQKNAESYVMCESDASVAATTQRTLDGPDCSKEPDCVASAVDSSRACFFCGSKQKHSRKFCPARSATCHKCLKIGHYARVCKGVARKALQDDSACFPPATCAIQQAPQCLRFAVVDVCVRGERLSALVDPGSSLSYLNDETAKALHLKIQPYGQSVARAVGSLKQAVLGRCITDVTLGQTVYKDVILGVMKNLCSDILLGQDFQRQHQRVVFTYDGDKPELVISSLSSDTCAVAAATVGCPPLFKYLTNGCRPVCAPSRRYNASDAAYIESEVKKLLAEGIIRESNSPWRAQPLVVTNSETKKRRLCIDYSQTINLFTILDAYPLPRIEDIVSKLAKYRVFSTFDLKSAYHQLELREADKAFTAFEAAGRLWEYNRLPFGITNGVPAFQRTMDALVDSEKLRDTFPYLDNVTVGGITQAEHDENVKRLLRVLKEKNMTLNEDKTISSVSEVSILGYCVSHGVMKPDPERLRPLKELSPPTGKSPYNVLWVCLRTTQNGYPVFPIRSPG